MLSCAIALILLVDVSGSISEDNYNLQRRGIAQAFQDQSIQDTIKAQPGGVALSLLEWSNNVKISIPWRVLKTKDDIDSFASDVIVAPRTSTELTALGNALDKALDYMGETPCEPDTKIIDISGDGPSNLKQEPDEPKERAIREGVIINGLPIITIVYPEIVDYYRDRVITPNGFLVEATDFEDFGKAMRRKLILEIAGKL